MSNLLSNQKFIHSVSPKLVASNGHELPTEDLVYKNEPCWAYILHNIKNGMWYIGISTQHPDEYKTTSDNKELAMAFSRNEIKRYIIKTGYDLEQMKRYESDLINDTNAEHDPMSYNEGPGIVSKDVLREPNLNMMKDIADGILNERSLMGAKFYTIDLGNDKSIKKGKGYFLPDSKLNDLVKFQSRKVLINYDHVNDLAQYIDAANGNLKTLEEQTGQKLLVVILRDVLHEGRMVDLVIGGNHTLLAIEKSKYGFSLPICDIPKSLHGAWIKPELRGLSEYLNPISAIKKLETNEDDLIKTGVSFAHDYGPESDVIKNHLDNHGIVGKQRTRIRSNITKKYNEDKNKSSIPENFITYENAEDTRIQQVKKDREDGKTYVSVLSSGKLSVGDVVQRAVEKIKNGKINYNKIHLIVYHPDPSAKKTFDDKWIKMIHAWDWFRDPQKCESLTYEEMPYQKEELK